MSKIVLLAIYSANNIKCSAILSNLDKIINKVDGVMIVDSIDTKYSEKIKTIILGKYGSNKILCYEQIPNDKYVDFGKWMFLINKYQNVIMKFDNTVFMNDSFFITTNLDLYFDQIKDYDMYGMTDSHEIQYHYQSYLFTIKTNKLNVFIDLYKKSENVITCFQDVIENYEIKLCDLFDNKNNYIKTSKLVNNNIFCFSNMKKFNDLVEKDLLPIIKIKMFKNNEMCYKYDIMYKFEHRKYKINQQSDNLYHKLLVNKYKIIMVDLD